jgi:hypothetical protein
MSVILLVEWTRFTPVVNDGILSLN